MNLVTHVLPIGAAVGLAFVGLWAAWQEPAPQVPVLAQPAALPAADVAPRAPARLQAPAMAETPTPPLPPVVLTGVAQGSDGRWMALVSFDRRPAAVLRVGDAIAPATSIVAIDDASMTLRHAGRDHRVPVQVAPVAQAPVEPVATPAISPPAKAPAAVGAAPGSGNAAFRQAVEKKMLAITSGT